MRAGALTSYEHQRDHELEDAVDEREGEHDLQVLRGEGQLDDGAAQLGVLEARLQGDGAAPEARSAQKKGPNKLRFKEFRCSFIFIFLYFSWLARR